MLVKEALYIAGARLKKTSDTPVIDARALLCLALECDHDALITKYNEEINQKQQDVFWGYVERRANAEPVAYIRGSQEFYSLEFNVTPDVLIPRSETELLVDEALKHVGREPAHILELGVGSGAISIAIAKNAPESRLLAVDISPAALEVARGNARAHQMSAQIEFIQSDWYGAIDAQKFDLIISNPPYISASERDMVSDSTHKFEPHLALYANDAGLACYRKIIGGAKGHLKKGGLIMLEIGCNQASAVSALLAQNAFQNIRIIQDYAGLDRVVVGSVCMNKSRCFCKNP